MTEDATQFELIDNILKITDLRHPTNLRKSSLFEVYLTPLGLPIDEQVLNISYGDLSRALRYKIMGYNVDYKNHQVTFNVYKDGNYDLAFIEALKTTEPKELLIYQYNTDGSLLHTLVVRVVELIDYNLNGTWEDQLSDNSITSITVDARVGFRIK